MQHLSEQEIIRRQKLEELQQLGINPYPAELFEVNVQSADILQNYERDKLGYKNVSIAGRIMSVPSAAA
jgi:lysyl-tRNA synthetase class 2